MVRITSLGIAVLGLLAVAPASATEETRLVWQVENPFRFWRKPEMFERHQRAYAAVIAENGGEIPADVILRMENRLNAVDCTDRSTPDRCHATAPDPALFETQRAGWAAGSVDDVCYDRDRLRHRVRCERAGDRKTFEEDYILPAGHTVRIGLPEDLKATLGSQRCVWTWRPRADIGIREEMRTLRCTEDLVIERVPYDPVQARSGLSVDVTLPDGSAVFEEVVVRDLLVVGFGDSFASGEGNPDRPVRFSTWRSMRYASECGQTTSQSSQKLVAPHFGQIPKRLLPDDRLASGNITLCTSEGRSAFLANGPTWLSPDCHRSQYSHQFRTATGLALEDRHRAVTFVHLACTGSEVIAGLFEDTEAREGFEANRRARVAGQFKQFTDLLCLNDRDRAKAAYDIPGFDYGETTIRNRRVRIDWCPPQARKRAVDLVLLSIGGNDVGFSSLAAYGIMDDASDLGPIVQWVGGEIRFPPKTARHYLEALDERLAAVKRALLEGFGVTPDRVVQTSYEPIQFDENNRPDDGSPESLCGRNPSLGMDVHPGLRFSRKRLGEVDQFVEGFLERLECISGRRQHDSCPANLATGGGTGFTLVTEHQAAFMNRGVCARDPARLEADTIEMTMPRRDGPEAFKPYNPSRFLPYASRWRLFRTANDAYLTANTHAECRDLMCPHLDDFLQVAFAALYGGAIHPTAEAHALIADHVLAAARKVVAAPVVDQTVNPAAVGADEAPAETTGPLRLAPAPGSDGLTPPPVEDVPADQPG